MHCHKDNKSPPSGYEQLWKLVENLSKHHPAEARYKGGINHTMKAEELSTVLRQFCRFRLKNGRDIYGVLFEDEEASKFLFASAKDHDVISKAPVDHQTQLRAVLGHPVKADEIISAERIAS